MPAKILIVQENGRHARNRDFRECFCLQRAFRKLGVACEVWGPGHVSGQVPFKDFAAGFDTILSLENYNTGWHPDLSQARQTKLFWCIDAHMGVDGYLNFVRQHGFDAVFNSSEVYVEDFARVCPRSLWLPNALDDTLIDRRPEVAKRHFVGFCGNTANRGEWIDHLKRRWGLHHDEMVLGQDMVRAINSYQVHWNRNISVDINFRTFETLGCGTLLLTNPTPGLDKLFRLGQDLMVYASVAEADDLLDLCQKHPEKAAAIAQRGYEAVRRQHTYLHRAREILQLLSTTSPAASAPPALEIRGRSDGFPAAAPGEPESLAGFIECFRQRQYLQAAGLGAALLAQGRLEALEPVFCLAGALFRSGNKEPALQLLQAMLSLVPNWRPAVELRAKLTSDPTYRTTENPVVPEVQVAAYRHFAELCGNATVIEVGCGTGLGTSIMTDAGAQVTATDLEATCLEYARKRYNRAVAYRQCSGTSLPFPDKSFDYAVSVDVIEHIADFDLAIAEMRRVARKGVFISTPNRLPENTNPDGSPKNYWHLFEWSPPEISSVLQRHFAAWELGFVVEDAGRWGYLPEIPDAPAKTQALVAHGWLETAKATAPIPPTRGPAPPRKAKRLQLVYAGDPTNDSSVRAPETIANHLFRHFEGRLPVAYRDWTDTSPVSLEPGDLILGHPHYHPATSIQRLFQAGPCVAKCLIFPFHHGLPHINQPFTPLVEAADRVFSITGEYWYNTLPQSALAPWGTRMTRVDMAVDIARFPLRKHRFHAPGQRVLLYLGTDVPEKGVKHLAALVRASGMKLIYAGMLDGSRNDFQGLDFEYWGQVVLNDETLTRIAEECDLFVNTSVSDANPTTILELAATGLPVLCTPQSGYTRPDLVYSLRLDDPEHNLAVLNAIQNASESSLKERAIAARTTVAREYTWDRFCATVERGLEDYL